MAADSGEHKQQVTSQPARRNLGLLQLLPFLAVALFVGGFALAGASHYVMPWYDEVCFVDTAASSYFGQGFTSGAWNHQPMDKPFATYPPLGIAAYVPWFEVFGFSLRSARAFNIFLMLLTASISAWTLWRSRLVNHPPVLLLFFLLLMTGQGVTFVMWSGRLEPFTMLILTVEFAVIVLVKHWSKYLWLAALGALIPLTQFLPVVYTFAIFATLFVLRLPVWKTGLAHGIGMALGLASLFAYLSAVQMLDFFLGTIKWVSGTTWDYAMKYGVLRDGTLDFLFLFACVLSLLLWRKKTLELRSPVLVGVLLCVSIYLFVQGLSPYFAFYSSCVVYLILLLCVIVQLDRLWDDLRNRLDYRLVRFWSLSILLIPGFFLIYSVDVCLQWRARDYQDVEVFMKQQVRPQEVVFADCSAFYAIKPWAKRVFYRPRDSTLTDEEKRSINKLVLAWPMTLERMEQKIGGKWRLVGRLEKPFKNRLLPFEWVDNYRGYSYDFSVYERVGP